MNLALRAARAWGERPLLYLTGRGKRERWTRQDRALAEAHLVYEDSLNAQGIPWHIASDPDRVFDYDERYDRAAAVYETTMDEYRKGGNVEPGMRIIVVDRGVRDAGS